MSGMIPGRKSAIYYNMLSINILMSAAFCGSSAFGRVSGFDKRFFAVNRNG
jgi:hypothetical protein